MRMRRPLLAAIGIAAVFLGVPHIGATPAVADAAATVVPVRVTGEPGQRFNLIFVGDGYTDADLPEFRQHIDKHVNTLLTMEPFKSYRNYLNIYTVEVASKVSGVSCDPDLDSPKRDTPLKMGFWNGCRSQPQRGLSVDSAALTNYANMVTGTTAANRQLVAIANSETYGGIGGTYATASGGNAMSALITPHELGHSLGGLDDEYDYYNRGEKGGTYSGGEPASIHHTLLTEQQMKDRQAKWWRWLGEQSESGGPIGRYEAGLYQSKNVWRPSKHSLMKTLGYQFDQISRERMTQRIAGKTSILADSTPTGTIGADRIVWVETLHPNNHQLAVTWSLDGTTLNTNGSRSVDLAALNVKPGKHTLKVTVVDPTAFVRDPAVRASAALTKTRTWTVDTAVRTTKNPTPVEFIRSTLTDRPVGARDVVYAEAWRPVDRVLRISWAVDGAAVVPKSANDRDLDLKDIPLTPGNHRLTATATDPVTRSAATLEWTIDASKPVAEHELTGSLLPTAHIYNAPFDMRLTTTDNTPGFAVSEFRTNGDGWFNYFGWPTDADLPFHFTAAGTVIDNLVYGKLGTPRLSPWDDSTPSYGTHMIEYRGTDAAGNESEVKSFKVTLLKPSPSCTSTIRGDHAGPVAVRSGVVCLDGARVSGPVTVERGASLVAVKSAISGPLRSTGAGSVELFDTRVAGPVHIVGTTRNVTVVGGEFVGGVVLSDNRTVEPVVLAGATIAGALGCSGNAAVGDLGAKNTVSVRPTDQCVAVVG